MGKTTFLTGLSDPLDIFMSEKSRRKKSSSKFQNDISFLLGETNDNYLSISNTVLKENKTSYMPQYKTLLKEIGINIEKGRTEIIV